MGVVGGFHLCGGCMAWVAWWEELYLCEDKTDSNERRLQTVLQIKQTEEKQI